MFLFYSPKISNSKTFYFHYKIFLTVR
ncbi:hypothetical protein GGQ19_000237 [Salinibacter ruber]|nr:hypothetical protein [Salinibacter ruber]